MKKVTKIALAAGMLLIGSAAQACTLNAWQDAGGAATSSGLVVTGGPGETPNLARYGGLCSMQATGLGLVRDEKPVGEAQIRLRFYFLAQGSPTGSTDLLVAASDNAGTTPVFTISFDGTNVTLTSNDGGTNASAPVGMTNWHSVEVNWNQNGAIDLWVDSDARTAGASDSGSSGAPSTIESVTLGAPADLGTGATGFLFDDYESRRTTAIGLLCPGDVAVTGGLDNNRDFGDVLAIFDEVSSFGTTPTTAGAPDFDSSGGVDFGDVLGVFDLVSIFAGACP